MLKGSPTTKAPKPPRAEIAVDVVNPAYEGATIEMVGKALLRRPPKADDEGEEESPDAHSPT